MKGRICCLFTALSVLSLVACSQNDAETNKIFPIASSSEPTPPRTSTEPEATRIPLGTKLHVVLVDGLSLSENKAGDEFTASLAAPVMIDGNMVLAKNTTVKGRITDLAESGRVKGRASIRLVLTDILYQGADLAISTKPFLAVVQSTTRRDAAIIVGGSGIGVGGIAGGGKGALSGATVRASGGTGTVFATKGKELRYPPETKMSFTLARDVSL